MDDITRLSRCVRCGAAVEQPDSDLCPSCIRELADTPTVLSDPATRLADQATQLSGGSAPTVVGSSGFGSTSFAESEHATFLAGPGTGAAVPRGPRPVPGQEFGPYRIERPLGRGGMGDVYEAEHQEHGRRVALKVLGQRLTTSEDRARFLREGELAASINHPSTVYIYGSEEIAGSPVIAMELLPGGTLKDLVHDRGPLPPQQAVDLILQVVDGLEAAHAAGILHRDIKPANCFIDQDGGVKVGDFGLSISTASREGAGAGLFQGTPQFAPPEQLRGEALDVRADIYAVGATLFYLLTGHPPFDDPDLTTLITRVKEEVPRSPREMREGVPDELAAVVMRCLAKDRNERPATYAELRERLFAFSSAAPAPAALWRRFAAGAVDHVALVMLNIPIAVTFVFRPGTNQTSRWWISIGQIVSSILYFAVFEGRWGAALGKRFTGIEVATRGGQRPGMLKAGVRGAFSQLASVLSLIPMMIWGAAAFTEYTLVHPGWTLLLSNLALAVQLVLLFSTARRRNGFAAIQDLATGTRVIRRRPRLADHLLDRVAAPANPGAADLRLFGPFEAVTALGRAGNAVVWTAADSRLKRPIWVLEQPLGTPALSQHVRDANRASRLRWLGGRRTATEAWDAFEALDGAALVDVDRPQPWRSVKRWLGDLAAEVEAGLADDSLPPLSLDRVWITRTGRARILEFRIPSTSAHTSAEFQPSLATAQTWMADVAVRGLAGPTSRGVSTPSDIRPGTLPLSARVVLDTLAAGRYATTSAMRAGIAALAPRADDIPLWRRAASVALAGALPVVLTLLGLVAAYALRRAPIGTESLAMDLKRITDLQGTMTGDAIRERRALETYVAATYRDTISNDLTWAISVNGESLRIYRPLATEIVARNPKVSPEVLAEAQNTLGPFLEKEAKAREGSVRRARIAPFVVPTFLFAFGLGVAALFGIVLAVLFRGGVLLRAFGIAVVTRSGRQASWLRAGWRGLVVWGPALVFALGMWRGDLKYDTEFSAKHPTAIIAAGVGLLLFLVGSMVAAWRAQRGLQDYAAGTWLVPR